MSLLMRASGNLRSKWRSWGAYALLPAMILGGILVEQYSWRPHVTHLSEEQQDEMIHAAMPALEREPLPATIKPRGERATVYTISPDRQQAAVVFSEHRGLNTTRYRAVELGLQLYATETGKLLHQLLADGDSSKLTTLQIAFSRDGEVLYALSRSKSGGVKFQGWRVSDGTPLTEFEVTPFTAFTFAPNDKEVVFYHGRSGSNGSTLDLRDVTNPGFRRLLKNPDTVANSNLFACGNGQPDSVYFSPDGNTLTVHGDNRTMTRWRVH